MLAPIVSRTIDTTGRIKGRVERPEPPPRSAHERSIFHRGTRTRVGHFPEVRQAAQAASKHLKSLRLTLRLAARSGAHDNVIRHSTDELKLLVRRLKATGQYSSGWRRLMQHFFRRVKRAQEPADEAQPHQHGRTAQRSETGSARGRTRGRSRPGRR